MRPPQMLDMGRSQYGDTPSFVNSSSPSDSKSKRPTCMTRGVAGTKSSTVPCFAPWRCSLGVAVAGTLQVDNTPRGLLRR